MVLTARHDDDDDDNITYINRSTWHLLTKTHTHSPTYTHTHTHTYIYIYIYIYIIFFLLVQREKKSKYFKVNRSTKRFFSITFFLLLHVFLTCCCQRAFNDFDGVVAAFYCGD